MTEITYKSAGVDLEKYADSMSRLPRLMSRTHTPRVVPWADGFAGLFQLDFGGKLFSRRYENPVLVSGTDGVGTKLKVATMCGRHSTVGIDLVAMCVNDVICSGAEPLFFLDYVAMSHDDPPLLEQIVQGVSDGCVQSGCALLGGETAIMPDLYQRGDYDLAGFCVGVIERDHCVTGSRIAAGDVVIGIPSSGFHSNGYSLIRKAVFEHGKLSVDSTIEALNATVADILLKPTRLYPAAVTSLMSVPAIRESLHGIAHITGGGLPDNIERILPPSVDVRLDSTSWSPGPEFLWLETLAQIARQEMYRVFNMGIGMTFILHPSQCDAAFTALDVAGYSDARVIGNVTTGQQKVIGLE
jgi:phosphoribosylformylglycinamidine cyclo-ligase